MLELRVRDVRQRAPAHERSRGRNGRIRSESEWLSISGRARVKLLMKEYPWSSETLLEHPSIHFTSECWHWTGYCSPSGYPYCSFKSYPMRVHRLSYELFKGPIPQGFTIDHLCRNKKCVNPSHLECVTVAENIRRAAAVRTHCVNGHALSGLNVSMQKDGQYTYRRCKSCGREATRKYRANKL